MSDLPELKLESALRNALPAWPAENDSNLFWIGLSCRFRYHNQPKIGDSENEKKPRNDFYCHPRHLIEKIRGFLEESSGGSIMVTGYRGTGKTSLVAESIREVQKRIEKRPISRIKPPAVPGDKSSSDTVKPDRVILQVRVNLSTVSTPHEVLVLSIESLTQALRHRAPWNRIECDNYKFILEKFDEIVDRINSSRVEKHAPPPHPQFAAIAESVPRIRGHKENTFQSEAISIAQAKFRDRIADLRNGTFWTASRTECFKVPMIIFVFDEIDKFRSLGNAVGEDGEPSRIVQLQTIVAQLKSFLAEARSHQIFVAGKDADDNWAEDQNKGEGVLESLFAANVYVPSVLSIGQLHPSRKDQLSFFGAPPPPKMVLPTSNPAATPIDTEPAEANLAPPPEAESTPTKTRGLYNLMAREIGISEKSMSYLTCFLIFPYLAEYEVYQLLKRIEKRHAKDPHALLGREKILNDAITHLAGQLENTLHADEKPPSALPPMSERTCRRLRTLMEYLTYKGRGIPRKILRELYSMVQPAPPDTVDPNSLAKLYIRHKGLTGKKKVKKAANHPKRADPTLLNIIALPSHQIQRMSFYASIMDTLDQSFNEFSGMIDKQRVAIFHIVDHILKFYSTGFNRQDIEHASFMTTREEIYPGRPLAMTILRIMEGKLWKRRTLSGEEFRLLHYVNHDLGVLFLRYAPEQMELRHTSADFRHELANLDAAISAPAGMKSYHAQMRKGRIFELIGSHHEARLAYHRALEWIRSDLGTLWAARDKNPMFPFTEPLVAHAIDCLLALGRLHEEVSENSDAVRIYEEIEHLYLSYTRQEKSSCDCESPCDHKQDPLKRTAKKKASNNKAKQASLPPAAPSPVPSSAGDDEVVILLKTLLPAEMRIPLHEDQLRKLLQKTPPVSPSALKAADIGLIRSYNQSSICYAKMSERASGNERLLRALFHFDKIGDEQGMIDQMVLIAHVLLRRRDLRSASRWYLAALHRIRRIRRYSNLESTGDPKRFREQTGAEWQTPAISKSTEAQIWAYLGDICHATSGVAFLDDPPAQPTPELVEEKLREIIEKLDCPVYEDRILEYFFTTARHRFQEMGDRDSATNVLLRQLEFRMRQLRRTIRRLKDHPQQAPREAGVADLFDFLTTWRGFWKSSRLALESQYIAPNSLSRNRSNFRGRPADNRLIGNASRLVGEFLRETSFYISIVQEVFSHAQSPGDGSAVWRGITSKQLETEGMRRATWLPSAKSAGHEKHISEIVSGKAPVLGYDHYRAIMSQILNVRADKANFGDPFAARGTIQRNHPALPEERGMASPIYRVNTGGDENPGVNASELVIEAVQRKAKKIFTQGGTQDHARFNTLDDQLSVLGAAEAAVLHGYLYHRDSMLDFEQAMTTMEACSVYHSALYLMQLSFEPNGVLASAATSGDANLHDLQDILHDVAKRFAVNTIDILKREREQNRNTYALLSEAYFGLGELLLFRIKRILGAPAQCLPGDSKSDLVLADLWRQTWSAFRDGLYCILMEIEDLDHRYRLPAEVTHASGNLMDPVLHFRICRSVGQRHVSFRRQRMTHAEIEGIINEINSAVSGVMPYGSEASVWLHELAIRVKLASRLRTDRPTVEIRDPTKSPKQKSHAKPRNSGKARRLEICFVELKDFGRGRRFAYFGPTSDKDRGTAP